MRFNFLLLCCICSFLETAAQPVSYAAALIPPALKENADAVRRYRLVEYEVKNPGNITLHYKEAVTILNSNASDYTRLVVGYDKFSKIEELSAVLYDANGKELKKYKSKDFSDMAARDGFSLYLDNRIKTIEATAATVPFTIETRFSIQYKGFLSFWPFNAYPDYRFSVENDEYRLLTPADYGFRYKTLNGAPEPEKLPDGALRWRYANLPAQVEEPFSPSLENYTPGVMVAPNRIEYDGVEGDISTWENLGKWSWQLLQGRDALPPETTKKIREMTADAAGTAEKVCRVYEYVQQRTRYVSIQLGIGGFQPFSAREVDETGYGDCKALSNYTRALLAAAAVPSYYTVVGAGDDTRIRFPDFCSFGQSNHVILAVPDGANDTLWLECTSQTQPCKMQGEFTSNRLALLVTPEGGKLRPTKHYTLKDNRIERFFNMKINADGSADGAAQFAGYGLAYENYSPVLHSKGREADEWMAENFPVLNARPGKYTASAAEGPVSRIEVNFSTPRLATPQGRHLYFPVCPVQSTVFSKSGDTRRAPFFIRYDVAKVDTFLYSLPANFTAEYLPKSKNITTPFGTYNLDVLIQPDKTLRVTRQLTALSGTYPAEHWKAYSDFLKRVQTADSEKVVLLKEERP
jgi:transglutaminase-like putative cysteine protease